MCSCCSGRDNRSRYAYTASSPITSPSRAIPSCSMSVRYCCLMDEPPAKQPLILALRRTMVGGVLFFRLLCTTTGLCSSGEIGFWHLVLNCSIDRSTWLGTTLSGELDLEQERLTKNVSSAHSPPTPALGAPTTDRQELHEKKVHVD